MIRITAKCVVCGHVWAMSMDDLEQAEEMGCASCPECYGPATAEKAEAT